MVRTGAAVARSIAGSWPGGRVARALGEGRGAEGCAAHVHQKVNGRRILPQEKAGAIAAAREGPRGCGPKRAHLIYGNAAAGGPMKMWLVCGGPGPAPPR